MKTRLTVIAAIASCVIPPLGVAQAATCYQFSVVVNSQVSGNFGAKQGSVQQIAILRDEGVRNNQFEFAIRYPGDMNAFDVSAGSLEVMTNSMFARNPGMANVAMDLASTSHDGNNQFEFEINPSASFQQPQPNVITVPGIGNAQGGFGQFCVSPAMQALCDQFSGMGESGVLSISYLIPQRGGGRFVLGNGGISGELDLIGFQLDNPNNQGRLIGSFQGLLVGQGAC